MPGASPAQPAEGTGWAPPREPHQASTGTQRGQATGAGDSAGQAEVVGRTSPTEESGTSPCYGEGGSRHQCPKRAHQGHTPGTVLTGPQANEATDLPSGESARQLTSCPRDNQFQTSNLPTGPLAGHPSPPESVRQPCPWRPNPAFQSPSTTFTFSVNADFNARVSYS